jgi:hypothetical protein
MPDASVGPAGPCDVPLPAGVEVLIDGQHHIDDLEVRGGEIFWTEWGVSGTTECTDEPIGSVRKMNVDGTAPAILVPDQPCPRALSVDDRFVYWVNESTCNWEVRFRPLGAIRSVHLDGSVVDTLDSGLCYPGDVTSDGTTVAWVEGGGITVNQTIVARVYSRPVDGGPVTTVLDDVAPYLWRMAENATTYFVWGTEAAFVGEPIPAITSVPKPLGGGWSQIATPGLNVSAVVADETHVYWTDDDARSVLRVPVGGGGTATLAARLGVPRDLVVDGTTLFFTHDGPARADGAISRVAVDGVGGATLVQGNLGCPTAMAVDATHVYWADDTRIYRRPREDVGAPPAVP